MTARFSAGPIFELRPNHRAEREFAQQVESVFRPDDAAIARVRASILAQAPARSVTTARPSPRAGRFTWRLAALAAVLVVALASGFALIRSVPAGSSQAVAPGGSATASSQAATSATADLDQADTSLRLVLTAFRTSDAAGLKVVLVAYQARLAAIAIDVRRPGADVAAARTRLVSQASSLAAVGSAVAPANASLFKQVNADLAGIIASLPSKGTSAPANPGASHKPAPTPTPTPTKKPVSTAAPGNGKTNGNANAGGNGNGNAGGNGNGNAGGNGNGNAGGNGKGNGNGNAGGNGKGNSKNH
jgi:uncharacterized membrane protein YgcG